MARPDRSRWEQRNRLAGNPLLYRNPTDLMKDVEFFYKTSGFKKESEAETPDLALLKRGALWALSPNSKPGEDHAQQEPGQDSRDEPAKERLPTYIEVKAYEREQAKELRSLTKDLRIVLFACAIGAVVQGWSQESIVGANLYWPADLGIAPTGSIGAPKDYWNLVYFCLVNAIPYFAASIIGAFVSDPLADRFGRRTALLFAALCSLAGAVGGGGCRLWWELLICRFIQGIGMGAKSSVTPHWLIKKGRYGKAYSVLTRLRETRLQAARDLYSIYAHFKVQHLVFYGQESKDSNGQLTRIFRGTESQEHPGFFKRLRALFEIPRNRRAVIASSTVMASQQLCGINIFAFLATTIFNSSNIGPIRNLWFTLGFGAVNAVASIPAYWLITRFGRRSLLLWSLFLMFPLLLGTGSGLDNGGNAVKIVLVLSYTLVYSFGAGVMPFMYSSELFPLTYREVGMSFACSVNFGLAGLVATLVSLTSNYLEGNHLKLLGGSAGLDGVAFITVWFLMRSPEDAESLSLQDIDFLFGESTRDWVEYRSDGLLSWIRNGFRNSDETDSTFRDWLNKRERSKRVAR
ncbi:hypothetical protein MMC17_004850 [Xylographa soralifera]|nr:hypothetical protein [Xylographa soralifera]